jgi:hypothetical protein
VKNVRILSEVVMAILASALIQGCGDAGPSGTTSSAASCGNPSRTGASACPTGACAAGQYCFRPSGDAHRCIAGCASDENCGPNEWCVKCGSEAVGTCRSCKDDGKSVCAPPPAEVKECKRNSDMDLMCKGAGPEPLPPSGYTCSDPSVVPTDKSCVNLAGTDWCCP